VDFENPYQSPPATAGSRIGEAVEGDRICFVSNFDSFRSFFLPLVGGILCLGFALLVFLFFVFLVGGNQTFGVLVFVGGPGYFGFKLTAHAFKNLFSPKQVEIDSRGVTVVVNRARLIPWSEIAKVKSPRMPSFRLFPARRRFKLIGRNGKVLTMIHGPFPDITKIKRAIRSADGYPSKQKRSIAPSS